MKRPSTQQPVVKRRKIDILDTDPGTLVLPYLTATGLAALGSTSKGMKAMVHDPLHKQLMMLVGFRDAMMKGYLYAIRYLYHKTQFYIYDNEFADLVNRAIKVHGSEFVRFLVEIDVPMNRGNADMCQNIQTIDVFCEFGLPPTCNALLFAAQEDNVKVLAYLMEKFDMKPDADIMGAAYREGNMRTTKFLVESGIKPHPTAVEDALDIGLFAGLACYLARHSDPPFYYVNEIIQYRNQVYQDILQVWLRRGIRPWSAAIDREAMAGNATSLELLASFGLYASKEAIAHGVDSGYEIEHCRKP